MQDQSSSMTQTFSCSLSVFLFRGFDIPAEIFNCLLLYLFTNSFHFGERFSALTLLFFTDASTDLKNLHLATTSPNINVRQSEHFNLTFLSYCLVFDVQRQRLCKVHIKLKKNKIKKKLKSSNVKV